MKNYNLFFLVTIFSFFSCSNDDIFQNDFENNLETTSFTGKPYHLEFGNLSFEPTQNNLDVYNNGHFETSILIKDNSYDIVDTNELGGGVKFTNTTSGDEFVMFNIRLANDKKSFLYDIKDNNGFIIQDLKFVSDVELPELPVRETDGFGDWIRGVIKDIKDGARELIGEVSEAVEHIVQHVSGAASPCPPGTGRSYGYDQNGKPWSRCE
ncbi:MAG: hypothetical protein ACTHYV_06855 [Psychroflexus sp.]